MVGRGGCVLSKRYSNDLRQRKTAGVCLLVLLATAGSCRAALALASATEAAAVNSDAQSAAVPATAAARFFIQELRILGNTTLPAVEIERVSYAFLGPGKTLEDVQSARLALENLYHSKGFGTVFVDIPEQSVADGIVRLRVTEGKLARTRTTGAQYFSERQISNALPEGSEGRVPNLTTLQSQLQALNVVTPDRAVTPILKAGAAPGTVDLTLRVDDRSPFHGSVELNNQNTVQTSSLRLLGSLSYDNLFRRADSVSVQYQMSPQERGEVAVFVGNLVTHVGDARVAFHYLRSNSNVASIGSSAAAGGALQSSSLAIIGRGSSFGGQLLLTLENTAAATHSLSFGTEYKDFLQAINPVNPVDSANPGASLTTPIRYIAFAADYAGFWRRERLQQSFEASANFGIRPTGNNPGEFDNKRFLARPNYFYIRSAYSLASHLAHDFTLVWRLSGQAAMEPLISNEQFSIAGADGVRGYLEAEELADRALKTSLQLGSPRWQFAAGRAYAEAFTFFDIGRIAVIDPLPQEPDGTTLRSCGIGLSVALANKLSGGLTWAYPLSAGSATPRGSSRWLFSVRGFW